MTSIPVSLSSWQPVSVYRIETGAVLFDGGGICKPSSSTPTACYTTGSISVGKPDPRLCLVALEQSGVAAADALFVGHKQGELNGAQAVGMHTVAFNADSAAQAEYTIVRFADLLDLPVLQTVT